MMFGRMRWDSVENPPGINKLREEMHRCQAQIWLFFRGRVNSRILRKELHRNCSLSEYLQFTCINPVKDTSLVSKEQHQLEKEKSRLGGRPKPAANVNSYVYLLINEEFLETFSEQSQKNPLRDWKSISITNFFSLQSSVSRARQLRNSTKNTQI